MSLLINLAVVQVCLDGDTYTVAVERLPVQIQLTASGYTSTFSTTCVFTHTTSSYLPEREGMSSGHIAVYSVHNQIRRSSFDIPGPIQMRTG
jgi:hypothetical protein